MSPPRAQRIYLDNEEWQAKVAALMNSAAPVMVLVGKGGAEFGWEVRRAFDSVDRSRLLLLVTRGRRQYEGGRLAFERATAVRMPPYRKVNRMIGPSWFMGANCFLACPAEGDDVAVLRLRAPLPWGFGSLTAEARYALKPVFERLGVRRSPPPISTANILGAIVFFTLVVMLLVLAFD